MKSIAPTKVYPIYWNQFDCKIKNLFLFNKHQSLLTSFLICGLNINWMNCVRIGNYQMWFDFVRRKKKSLVRFIILIGASMNAFTNYIAIFFDGTTHNPIKSMGMPSTLLFSWSQLYFQVIGFLLMAFASRMSLQKFPLQLIHSEK